MADRERKHDEDEALAEGTLVSHLIELRQRLVRAMLAVLVIFLCLFPFSEEIFLFIAQPMEDVLPEGSTFQIIGVADSFLTPLKTTMYAALFVAMPVVLYQIWRFVAPGLYRQERRFAVPLLASSIVLFYCGIAFAYFFVFKLVFGFFISVAPEGVVNNPNIAQYLSFVLRIFFAFGIAFEMPIAVFMLVWSRLVSIENLGKQRPYVLLGCFVVAMFMTPPDVFSQTLLAIPMYLLFESGLIMARFLLRDQLKATAEAKAAEAAEAAEGKAQEDSDGN
jgi:sec-independent protein translocase protein TatC